MFFKLAVCSAAIMLRPTQTGFRPDGGIVAPIAGHSFQIGIRPDVARWKPLPETVAASRRIEKPLTIETALPTAPGAPGTHWRDEKGVVRCVPIVRERRAIKPREAVNRFAEWLRDWGYTGWMISDDLVGHYINFCADEALEEMSHDDVRALFAKLPGIVAGRKRINGPQFADLRRYLAATGRLRTEAHLNRFEVFRVAGHEELMAEQTPRRRRAA